MDRRSPVRYGTNLSAVGAGNIDVLGAGYTTEGWMGWCLFRKRLVGDSNRCIKHW